MLDDGEAVTSRLLVNHPFDDTQCAIQPATVAGDIGQGQECFGAMHVAVGAAIGFLVAPVTREGCGNTMFDQRQAARNALDMGHGKTVGHAGSIHGFGHGLSGQAPLPVEIAEPFIEPGGPGERQQALSFGHQPGSVGRSVQPTAERKFKAVARHALHLYCYSGAYSGAGHWPVVLRILTSARAATGNEG